MLINGSPLNSTALNGSSLSATTAPPSIIDVDAGWRVVYLLEVDGQRVPMSSFQATMRREGQSFLQAVVPDGSTYLDALTAGAPMRVLMGYLQPDDTLTDLLEIAAAPLQIIRQDQGPQSDTLSISGYGAAPDPGAGERSLRGVSYRSINQGVRRVRCDVDIYLRAGHTAVDADGSSFMVKLIQYFVGDGTQRMEVVQDG